MKKAESNTPFILLEGMDLSGKSTVLSELKKLFNWNSNHLSLSENKLMYSIVNRISKSGNYSKAEIGYLYVAVLNMEIGNFTWPSSPTFQDSCVLLRALAHHTAYQNKDIVFMLEKIAETHPKFSESYLFTASIKERIRRLNKRQSQDPTKNDNTDRLILNNPELFVEMEKAIIMYSKKYFNANVIDSDEITTDEIVQSIRKRIDII